MSEARLIWKNALLVGAVTALLEGALVLAVDPAVHPWMLAQGVLFWLGCGMVVYMAESGIPPLLHSLVLTVLLNIPWYIALSVAPQKLTLLPPLIGASVVFGIVGGLLRKRLRRS